MEYNSTREKLVMPEYGRHIQNMINHAMTIEDREERNKCARTIINIMANMASSQRETQDFWQKLWDHLAIMSNFKLDIDAPYEMPQANRLHNRPERIPYQNNQIRLRHYGKYVEKFIDEAVATAEPEKRRQVVQDIANFMKKTLISLNKDFATDERLFNDMKMLSNDRLHVDEDVHTSHYTDPDKYADGQQSNFNNRRQTNNNNNNNNKKKNNARNNTRNNNNKRNKR